MDTPSPLQSAAEKQQGRDAALALLEQARSGLIEHAFTCACLINSQKWSVSATDVWEVLYGQAKLDDNLAHWLKVADPRWMGAVFRESRGWTRVRWEESGSHKRPVAVWTR